MNETILKRVHWSFWLIAIVTLVWNAMGVMNYLLQTSGELPASMPDSHRAIIEDRPSWATGGFAIAVFAGVLGSVLLLLKKSASIWFFMLSLAGVIITLIHTYNVVSATEGFTGMELTLIMLMPVVVPLFLIWFANSAKNRNWIS